MASYAIDTAKAMAKLEDVKVPREQASVLVDLRAQSHEQVAIKADIEQLELKIDHFAESTKAAIERLETSTKKDLEWWEASLRTEIAKLRTEVANLQTQVIRWLIGTGIAILSIGKVLDFLLGGG